MNLRIFAAFFAFLFLSSCSYYDQECMETGTLELSFYDSALTNLRSKTLYDCQGRIREFTQYQAHCKNCFFQVFYSTEGSPDSIKGKPWLLSVYEDKVNQFSMGDTLKITWEIANPPSLESVFSVTDNDSNVFYERLSSFSFPWNIESDSSYSIPGTFYSYQTIINDTSEYFKLKNLFRYQGEDWITARRHQPVSTVAPLDSSELN